MPAPSVPSTAPWPPPRVLVVEDDDAMAAALCLSIGRSGMTSQRAGSGGQAMALVHSFLPDIVLIDLELPDVYGMELVRWLRAHHSCGMIIVTGNPEDGERVVGLELGADDYVGKPPPMRELIARIRAVHRRRPAAAADGQAVDGQAADGEPAGGQPPSVVRLGRVTVDLRQRRARHADGRVLGLTAAEFAVLEALVQADGHAVSREELSLRALRRPWRADDRSVDQLVFQIRNTLTPDDRTHDIIQTVRNVGYRAVLPSGTQ